MRNQRGLKSSTRRAVNAASRVAGRRSAGRFDRGHACHVEPLEGRRLFAVTLNNGLAPTDPNFFQVTLGAGDSVVPGSATLGQTSVVKEYTAFLDIGNGNVVDFSNIQANQGTATDAVAGTAANTAVSTLVINTTSFVNAAGKTIQNTITVDVTASLPQGSTSLTTTYRLQGSTFENMQGVRLFQYDDAAVSPANDNVFQTAGTIGTNDLSLTTINPDFFISTAQKSGTDIAGCNLTGWAAGLFPSLRQAINAGGYNPPVTGANSLTATNTPGYGATFGTGDVTDALAYTINASQNARVQTVLSCTVATPQLPVMQVLGFDTSSGVTTGTTLSYIPDGDTAPKTTDGTDFGQLSLPYTHNFEVRNIGGTVLSLPGNPRVVITGPNAGDFVVTQQPLPQVGTNLSSTFSIQFVAQGPGRRQATVTIQDNDFSHNPYTFDIAGGSGTVIQPDAFEPDNTPQQASTIPTDGTLQNHTINVSNDVDWAKFTLTQASAVNIQTNGAIGDTRMWLYGATDQTNALLFNDNNGINLFSQIYDPALPAGTYYIKVDSNGENNPIPAYTLSVLASTAQTPGGSPGQFATLTNGILTVQGTALPDTIDVAISGSSVEATLNGTSLFFPVTSVTGVNVNAAGGNDQVTIGSGVVAPTVHGGGGNDSIVGGNAGGFFYGGAGDDTILGSTGADQIFGLGGNDSLGGLSGNDTIYGGDGADTVNGNGGDDLLFGGAGDDMMDGGVGNDSVYGRAGNDTLTGGDGNDQLFGGVGDDSFFARDSLADTIDGGAGNNLAQVDAGLDVVVNVQTIL